ncbi:MAG: sigma-54-dependent Fis family transcriptional regulator, partial [Desulfuromonadaceae bacterium]|nr:sigma-54-dependent Fis family transcriptional regulator [Desulfuromonadaceae bacterium]
GEIISCDDLPPDIAKVQNAAPLNDSQVTNEGIDMGQVIADIERQMIQQAMDLGQGVKARAAELLAINRTTLVEKIKRLGL